MKKRLKMICWELFVIIFVMVCVLLSLMFVLLLPENICLTVVSLVSIIGSLISLMVIGFLLL